MAYLWAAGGSDIFFFLFSYFAFLAFAAVVAEFWENIMIGHFFTVLSTFVISIIGVCGCLLESLVASSREYMWNNNNSYMSSPAENGIMNT